MAPPGGPMKDFLDKVDVLITDVVNAGDCTVMGVEKSYSLFSQEAVFAIRVSFKKDNKVEPDVVIDE